MVDDELPENNDAPAPLPPGPRRSTYTPPPAGVQYDPEATDDDALASALAAQTLAHTASVRIPPPPERRSLSDDELLAVADPSTAEGDTSNLIDLLERELALRHDEAARLAEWEEQVRATAGPEAESVVREVRARFTGVIPVVPPTASAAPPQTTVVPEPSAPPELSAPPKPTFPTSGPELDLALADAPPPFGAANTLVPPPPGSVPGPPELVEPAVPTTGSVPVSAPSVFEAMLTAADAPTGEVDTPTVEPDIEPGAEFSVESFTTSFAEPAVEPVAGGESRGGDELEVVTPSERVERTGLEPTAAEVRTGRSIRLFWLWFSVNASVVSLALGGVLLGLGLSLRQAILAALIGVAVAFLPLGLGTLASKWSGQPTMVVSRATFGTVGNVIPALVAFMTRLLWAGALLWILGTGLAELLNGSGLIDGLARFDLALAIAAVGLVIAATIAGLGFRAIAVLGVIVTSLGLVAIGGLIVLTTGYIDIPTALAIADGPWIGLASGAVLVFSVVGLAWANSSGDVARYQAKETYGSSAVLWASFGATIPAFALISWGALLAASNPFVAEGLVTNPVDIVSRMLPLWYPIPLALAIGLGLLAAASLALYSGGFALLAVGLRAPRPVAVTIVVVLSGLGTVGLALLAVDATSLFRDVVTTLAVPVAAWAGIFGAETMIRTRRVHSPSLLVSGGVYPRVRWVNTVMLLLITAIGWGLTTATLPGLGWQGYGWALLGVAGDDPLAAADLGVAVALTLGLLTPIVAGIPALRALQLAERSAAESDGLATSAVPTLISPSAAP